MVSRTVVSNRPTSSNRSFNERSVRLITSWILSSASSIAGLLSACRSTVLRRALYAFEHVKPLRIGRRRGDKARHVADFGQESVDSLAHVAASIIAFTPAI